MNRTDRLISVLKDNKYLAVVVVIGLVVIGVAQFTTALRDLKQHLTSAPEPVKPFEFSESDLRRETNPRFQFSFVYPKTWDRMDPDNADGNRYLNPTEPSVQCTFWGGHAVVTADLQEWINWSLAQDASRPGFELVHNVVSGRHIVEWEEKGEPISEIREQIEGRRVVYRQHGEDGKLTFMQLFLQVGDRQIGALCQAPDKRFPVYEPLFLALLADVRVLK